MSGSYFNPLKRIFLNLSGGTVTGDTIFTQGIYGNSITGSTFYSGSTNLEDIIFRLISGSTTGSTFGGAFLPLSGGTGGEYYFTGNTTGQTFLINNRLSVNDNFIVSGDTGVINTYNSISGVGLIGKFLSGTTSGFTLANISDITSVSAGISGDIQYNNGSNGFSAENIFNYNELTSTLRVYNFSATTVTAGTIYVEDNNVFINFNPDVSMTATSLGSGFIIQDGSGVSGVDVFLDIRGTDATVDNRSIATNLNDIRIRESGTASSPNGARVLAELDNLDAGFY